MKTSAILHLLLAFLSAAVTASANDGTIEDRSIEMSYGQLAQGVFGDGIGLNITHAYACYLFESNSTDSKLGNDIITALREEIQAFAPHNAIEALRDEIRALASNNGLLKGDIKDLKSENHRLKHTVEKLTSYAEDDEEQLSLCGSGNTTHPPSTLFFSNLNATYVLVSPERALANLLAALHLHQPFTSTSNETSDNKLDKRTFPPKHTNKRTTVLASTSAPTEKPTPTDDPLESILFGVVLSLVTLYLFMLCHLAGKRTFQQPDGKRRQIEFQVKRGLIQEHKEEQREWERKWNELEKKESDLVEREGILNRGAGVDA